ncbi:MAG: DUF4114 domain-containing protein [Aulosira sp. ZfuVER01]|nr:multicopper oxidase domain-containing protein [Aulosira sp. ZfuVER01]MDZ7997512.1 multicopper oxidase domain-containing protein [Aulosira sp. DedVER01a]MDZ8055623.1 multicopper oxidase domain-containing protein [Aulosira sp. ZfuCHP01]
MTNNLLDPDNQPKFLNLLPTPIRIDATKGGKFTIQMRETEQWLGLYAGPGADGVYGTPDDVRLNTNVWGYSYEGKNQNIFPGPTFVAQTDVPIKVRWENDLPKTGHLLPVDRSIHIAQPVQNTLENGYVPTVTHLHGGHSEAASDGAPEAWFTQDFSETGPQWVKKNYSYDNDQEASTLWYHDHALGLTRLNVYAGLAGFYLLRDQNENNLIHQGILPSGSYEREILIQDRMFTADGQLYFPSTDPPVEPDPLVDPNPPTPPNPSAIPEFFGNFIMVNGMAWPKMEVEPRKYRLRLANGSDSRFYILEFNDPQEKFYQIGTEQGFFKTPLALDKLVIAPGERADVIVDFTGDAGKEFILQNLGPDEPFMGLNEHPDEEPNLADPDTTGQILKIEVNQPLSSIPNAKVDTDETDGLTTELRSDEIEPLTQTGPTRQLVLFEGRDKFGRIRPELGTMADGSLLWDDPITEQPKLGTTEVWEFYNTTEDAHPIHLHLTNFQILNREKFNGDVVTAGKDAMEGTKQRLENVTLSGDVEAPLPSERGWKDTVIANPGEVVRIIAKFDKPGEYVWHCHILSHEDNEMMRPFKVVAENKQSHLTNPSHDIFHISNDSAKATLQFTLTGHNSQQVNEIGVFAVDDHTGKIGDLAPGSAGYAQLALDRAKVIFSTIANVPNGFRTDNLTKLLEVDSGANLRFYLVQNSTTDAVKTGVVPIGNVLFSDVSTQKITDLGNEAYSLAWKDIRGHSTDEFKDLVVTVQPTDQTLPLGTNLQGKLQGELINLQGVTQLVKADFIVNREAAFKNFVGFYQVADENGGIDVDGNGTVDLRIGDSGYTQAAVRGRVVGMDLTVNNQSTATYTGTFQPGAIFAPFMIANGRPEAILDGNPSNDPAIYFPFLGANADRVDHINLLGSNIFGFEDLANSGDKDFNDMIVQVNLTT